MAEDSEQEHMMAASPFISGRTTKFNDLPSVDGVRRSSDVALVADGLGVVQTLRASHLQIDPDESVVRAR